MKKIISIILAFALLSSFGIFAYADNYISYEGGQATSTISVNVDSSFIVVIPAVINGNDSYTFTAQEMRLTENQQVNIYCNEMQQSPEEIILTNDNGKTCSFRFNGMQGNGCVGAFTNGVLTSPFSVSGQFDDIGLDPGTYSGIANFTIYMSTVGNY